ncbi:MAG TPA: class I adenylate-forming enzyme family protein [Lacunisphaera sp.]|nr:class I adenylate-forming enzyme family protein [Lacunisphaera sp.]
MSHAMLQAWDRTVRHHGPERAVVQADNGTELSFGELDASATSWLATCGVDARQLRGRPVLFAEPNGIGWLRIFLGLLKAGAVAVPLDATEPRAAQRHIAGALRAAAWWNGTRLEPLARSRCYRDPSICLVKLTSGTTGRPQARVFTAGQLLADARQVTATMGLGRRDLNYALIPLGHSYGLGNLTVPLLAPGVPMVCGTAPLPHAIAADFARWRPTVFPGVPAMWRALAASPLRLDSLRLGISAGAPLPPEVARAFAARFGRRLHGFYGSSETGGIAYDRTGSATLAGGTGRALHGVKLTAASGARLLVASAAVLTHGNRRRSGRLGAWLMPDRVELGPDGGVRLLGRRGTTVKLAGRRVNLREISDRLLHLPGVREAWVGINSGADPGLGAAVVTDRTPAELRAALLAAAPAWKVPKILVVLAALPLTTRGKTDTRALQALVFDRRGPKP